MRQTSPTASTARRISHPASRIPIGSPLASSSTSTRCGTLSARSLSALFRVPRSDFRVCSRLIVDQCVAAFGESGPRLHLDDVVQERALEPELDLLDGGAEGAPPPCPRGGGLIAREELQLRGAGHESRELDGESLHRASGRRLLEPRLERSGEAHPVGGRVLEGRLDQPRRAVLELRPCAHHLHPPPDAARMFERALEQPAERVY